MDADIHSSIIWDLAKSRFNVCQNRRSDLNDQTKYSFKCSEYRKYPLCHFQIKIIIPDNNMNSITIMSKNEHEHEQNERNATTRLLSPIRESISNYVKCGLSQPQIKASLIINSVIEYIFFYDHFTIK